MIQLVPVSTSDENLLSQWFDGDNLGLKELSSYSNFPSWLKLLNPNSRWGWIAYDGEKALGFVDLEKEPSGTGYFSFYIAPQERGKRKSKELLLTLFDHARTLGISELQAGAKETNVASQKALESVGFTQNGRDKDNYIMYELTI